MAQTAFRIRKLTKNRIIDYILEENIIELNDYNKKEYNRIIKDLHNDKKDYYSKNIYEENDFNKKIILKHLNKYYTNY